MAVALVLDFPGGTKKQYDAVMRRMQLGGHTPPGGLVHIAGPLAGGWRVTDVWESLEQFGHFREAQIMPHTRAVGLSPPRVAAMEVADSMPADGRTPTFAQFVHLPGLDRERFRAIHAEVVPGGQRPTGLTFHVNGPYEGGWWVIDGWISKALRDTFMERTQQIIGQAPMAGLPVIEEMEVAATLAAGATAYA
jgi:hypothetical protein